ncbi:hypothetical protein Hanom_Chr14g01332501 [Helianthus anomalus]
MHMVVVTLALGVFQEKIVFFTFHKKYFIITFNQNYLFFFTFNPKFFIFCNLSSQLFYFQLWIFIVFIFRKFFVLCLVLNFVT